MNIIEDLEMAVSVLGEIEKILNLLPANPEIDKAKVLIQSVTDFAKKLNL